MRASALNYMFKRGVTAGTAILMAGFLLPSMLSDSGYFQMALWGAGGDILTVVLLYLTTSFLPAAFIGGIGGGIIGLLNGLYTRDFVRRHYGQITDARGYAFSLAWRTAGISVALTIAATMVFFSRAVTVWWLPLLILTALAGGFAGRGFAYHDMKLRREKKDTAKESAHYAERDTCHLELPDDVDNLPPNQEDVSQVKVIR